MNEEKIQPCQVNAPAPTTKFWFVWNPKRNLPNYKHSSYESAANEASRLSRLSTYLEEEFIVLESKIVVKSVATTHVRPL